MSISYMIKILTALVVKKRDHPEAFLLSRVFPQRVEVQSRTRRTMRK